jgi:hypothetical protein
VFYTQLAVFLLMKSFQKKASIILEHLRLDQENARKGLFRIFHSHLNTTLFL